MLSLGLLTQAELQQFGAETQAAVGYVTKGVTKRDASAYEAVAADRDTASRRRRKRSISLCARAALQPAARGR